MESLLRIRAKFFFNSLQISNAVIGLFFFLFDSRFEIQTETEGLSQIIDAIRPVSPAGVPLTANSTCFCGHKADDINYRAEVRPNPRTIPVR